MKKVLLVIILILTLPIFIVLRSGRLQETDTPNDNNDSNLFTEEKGYVALNYDNVKAIWLSQYDMLPVYLENGEQRDKSDFTQRVKEIFENISSLGINTVFVQVRPFGDSFYPSSVYPISSFVCGSYGKEVAYGTLSDGNRQYRQGVAENKIRRTERRGAKSLKQGSGAVFCYKGCRKKRQKRKSENRNAGCQLMHFKKIYGCVCSDGSQQKQQNYGKTESEAQIYRVAQDFLCVSFCERQYSHSLAPLTVRIKASSKLSVPAAFLIFSAVSHIMSLPSFIIAMRSESASASSI